MSWILDQDEVHLTVGSSIRMGSDGPDLQGDLRMVKAALLYSDHAKLVSLSSSALLDLVNAFDIPPTERLSFLRKSLGWQDEETKKKLTKMIALYDYANRRRYSKRGRDLLKSLNKALAEMWKGKQEENASVVSQLGADGIL